MIKKILLTATVLILLFSCSKNESEVNTTDQDLKISIKSSEGLSALMSTEKISRNDFIRNQIINIQENVGITNSNTINTEMPECNYIDDSNHGRSSVSYEIIPIKSDGIIKGYLWNYYTNNGNRSFYQEMKYDSNNKAVGFVLWSESGKYFYSTDESLYKPTETSKVFDMSSRSKEDYLSCVARVFQQAKAACDADPRCHLSCFLTGAACDGCMLAAAAAACALYN